MLNRGKLSSFHGDKVSGNCEDVQECLYAMLMCNSNDVNENGKFQLRDLSEAKCHSENDTGFDGEKRSPDGS